MDAIALSRIPPFDALPADALRRLAAEAREVRFERGEAIFEEGDPSDAIFVSADGRVHIQHFHADGSVRTSCVIAKGEVFCCLPALDGKPYPGTAVAAVPSTAYRVPGPLFREVLRSNPAFSAQILKRFASRLREVSCEGCLHAGDAGARLARQMLALSRRFGETVPLSRRELGELAGTTVETAIRTLKEFERAGWVELGRCRVRLLDAAALEARASGEGTPARVAVRLKDRGAA